MNTKRTGGCRWRGACERSEGRRRARVPLAALRIGIGISLTVLLFSVTAAQSEPDAAQPTANVHEIRWMHVAPAELRSFIIFVSSEPEAGGNSRFARRVDVGIPGGGNPAPLEVFSALVPVALNEFVAVAAVGSDGTQSALSAWMRPRLTRPGQPLLVEP